MQTSQDTPSGRALTELVRNADIEIIPVRNADEKLALIPTETTITVTCSQKFGIERTLATSLEAAAAGYRVIPHLAARQLTGRPELTTIVNRLSAGGVRDIYIIGGDAQTPEGPYSSALELLDDLAERVGHSFETVGVAGYPEGHPAIATDALFDALCAKQKYATYMASQLCFDPEALVAWLRNMRSTGITLPLHLGLAAPMNTRKLAEMSLKIGVGTSVRFLSKQHGLVGTLLRGNSYRPEEILLAIGPDLGSAELGIERVHLFSFNQTDLTVAWQRELVEAGTASAVSGS